MLSSAREEQKKNSNECQMRTDGWPTSFSSSREKRRSRDLKWINQFSSVSIISSVRSGIIKDAYLLFLSFQSTMIFLVMHRSIAHFLLPTIPKRFHYVTNHFLSRSLHRGLYGSEDGKLRCLSSHQKFKCDIKEVQMTVKQLSICGWERREISVVLLSFLDSSSLPGHGRNCNYEWQSSSRQQLRLNVYDTWRTYRQFDHRRERTLVFSADLQWSAERFQLQWNT